MLKIKIRNAGHASLDQRWNVFESIKRTVILTQSLSRASADTYLHFISRIHAQ